MKAAIIGTQNHNADPQIVLHDAGVTALQHMAGYIAPKMPVDSVKMPPVTIHDPVTADAIMTSLCGQKAHDCNRRAPYLMLAWLLVGSDNAFRVIDYAAHDSLLRPVTFILLRYALGSDLPLMQLQPTIDKSWLIKEQREGDIWAIWADETIAWMLWAIRCKHSSVEKAVEAAVWSATRLAIIHANILIQKQAKEWCHIDDEEAWLVIQFLLLDTLSHKQASEVPSATLLPHISAEFKRLSLVGRAKHLFWK